MVWGTCHDSRCDAEGYCKCPKIRQLWPLPACVFNAWLCICLCPRTHVSKSLCWVWYQQCLPLLLSGSQACLFGHVRSNQTCRELKINLLGDNGTQRRWDVLKKSELQESPAGSALQHELHSFFVGCIFCGKPLLPNRGVWGRALSCLEAGLPVR